MYRVRVAKLAGRNIFRNLRRSLLSALAIAVSALSIVMLFGLLDGMQEDMANNLKSYYTGEILIQHAEYEKYERFNPLHLSLPWKQLEPILASQENFAAATARIQFPANMYLGEKQQAVMATGIDFSQEEAFIDFPTILMEGRLPQQGKNEVLIGFALAREMGLSLGQKVTLLTTTASRGSNAFTCKIVGLAGFPVAALNISTLWLPLDRVQQFLGMGDEVQQILILLTEGSDSKVVAQQMKAAITHQTGLVTDTRSWTEINTLYGVLRIAKLAYYFIALFFFVLGSTVIINTTMMVIFERMREIGTLSALGMQGSELTLLFLFEGFFISALGAALGVILGYVATIYLGKVGLDFTEALSGMDMEISSILYPRTNLLTTGAVWLYAVVISTLSTFIPSRRAAKIQPVEALRYV